MEIKSLLKPICATLKMPGSKSYTNRALIMAALTKGSVSLKNPLDSEDTEAMIEALRTLGIRVDKEPDQIIVHGDVGDIAKTQHHLSVKNSGTTARFMLALLCIVPGIKILQGSPRLNKRPIRDLVEALQSLGAQIAYCNQLHQLPVKISSSRLFGDSVRLSGDVSSQFCSAILLISPYILCANKGFTMHIAGELISKPYVNMTLGCMQESGVHVVVQKPSSLYFVPASQSYRRVQYLIEGDFSSASYFFAIAALTRSTITVENLNPLSLQADRQFLKMLETMGNSVRYENNSLCIEGKQVVALDQVSMEDCPDQIMTMAVLAAFAKGVTQISGARSLRVKETDRVFALKKELGKMGIRVEETFDTLVIYGGLPHAAAIATYNDHRIAMAFAVAGVFLPGIVIHHPEVVCKTFPTFWEVLNELYE